MLQFDRVSLDDEAEVLRHQVRDFIEDNRAHLPKPNSDFVTGHDPEFSQKLSRPLLSIQHTSPLSTHAPVHY